MFTTHSSRTYRPDTKVSVDGYIVKAASMDYISGPDEVLRVGDDAYGTDPWKINPELT